MKKVNKSLVAEVFIMFLVLVSIMVNVFIYLINNNLEKHIISVFCENLPLIFIVSVPFAIVLTYKYLKEYNYI